MRRVNIERRWTVVFIGGLVLMLGCAQHAADRAAPPSARDHFAPRVPADQLAAAKAVRNPLQATPENLAKGQAIYQGRGRCWACHGPTGRGEGRQAIGMSPPPARFADPAFHAARSDGELIWILKHGSAGTSMAAFIGPWPLLTEEQGWLVIVYERSLRQ